MAKGFLGKGLRAAGVALVVLLLLLVVVILAVPVVGPRIANSQLSRILGTEVHIGEIELALFRGFLAVREVRVQQPEGFGRGDLLVVPEVRAKIRMRTLLEFPVRFEEVLLRDPGIQLVRNVEGNLDLDAIITAVLASSEGADPEVEPEPAGNVSPPDYPIVIEEAAVRNLWVSYRDDSSEQWATEAKLENLTFVVSNLSLESSPEQVPPTTEDGESEGSGAGMNRATLTLENIRIDQPPGFSGEALLNVPELFVKAQVPSLFEPRLTLEQVSLKKAAIHLARDPSGRLNLEALLAEMIPHPSGDSMAEQDVPLERQDDETPLDWTVRLKRLNIEGLSFLYTDDSFPQEPITARVADLSLDLKGLHLGPGEDPDAHEAGVKREGNGNEEAPGAAGSLVVKGVRMDQPPGFSGETLLSWAELQVDFVLDSILDPSIRILKADLLEPRLHLAYDKAGEGNVDRLISKAIPTPPEGPSQTETAPKAEGSGKTARIHVSKFSVHDLGFAFTDDSHGTKPMEARLRETDLQVMNLTYDPTGRETGTLPATIRMTGRRVQEPFADAPVGVYAKVGELGDEIPAMNASLQMGGFELAPVSHTLPQGTEQAIGGDALDLSVDLGLAVDVLDCEAKVKSIGGSNLSFRIGGTPAKPEADTSNMLFLLFFRSGGALGNVAGKLGGAGVEVADTAVGTVKVVGMGTAKTLGSVGGGLFHTAKGLATADLEGAADGLEKTTIGAVKEGAGIVVGTAGEVKDGAVGVGSAGLGQQQAEAWRNETEDRWEEAWKEAQARVDRMPYPRPE